MTKVHIAIRIPKPLLDAADRFAADKSPVGATLTRSDGIRMLAELGLDAVGRCAAVKGDAVCTLHAGHRGTHFDSHKDRSWK